MSKLIDSDPRGVAPQVQGELLDLYFQIHEKVNARGDEVSKSYSKDMVVEFSDVDDLHKKTIQTINSFSPAGGAVGELVAVSYCEGEVEKFSTFEKFRSGNSAKSAATAEIILAYNFSIFDDLGKNFEKYKVVIHIKSRLAELKQFEEEAPSFIPQEILANFVTKTAIITIHYEDYVKARTFVAMFDEWVKGCASSESIKIFSKVKPYSHLVPRFGKLLAYIALSFFVVRGIDLKVIVVDLLAKFIVVYASFFMVVGVLSETFLRRIERAIDGYLPLSYVKITKGDCRLLDDFQRRNRSSFLSSIFGVVGVCLVGLFTNFSYDLIKYFVLK